MSDLSIGKLTDALPLAIWLPRSSYDVYRGSPSEIIQELTGNKSTSMRQAIKKVTKSLEVTRRVKLELPWGESDDVLATLLVHAMLQLKISQPVPSA
jgi:hypothetical protein